MVKRDVFSILLILLLASGSIFYGCSRKTKESDKKDLQYEIRMEKEPIINRFSKLENCTACYWQGDIISDNSRFSIGPTPYWMKGFVVLSKDDFNSFKDGFEWEDIDTSWNPSLDVKILNRDTFRWSYSEEFDNYVRSSSYVGYFYMDLENGIVFFDVQQ